MLMPGQIEELIELVGSLDRSGLIRAFSNYDSSFPLDFSEDFLNDTPLERLQHIFIALCLQTAKMPGAVASEAA
jgi:hypothetical protein